MDVAEVEENFFAVSDAKLHGDMCRKLSALYCKILSIFPTLEAARPGSKTGIQALCALHIALEKAKKILHHCSECSKLYLAISGDAILLKFEKVKRALIYSLRNVEDIVPLTVGRQIQEIVSDLEGTVFSLDPLEKQIGNDVIALLQLGENLKSCGDNDELESFHRAVTKLGIFSSGAALSERRALKKLIEKARVEEDKQKESILAYLLHLMRKYSKLFVKEISDSIDSQSSAPCSPTVKASIAPRGLDLKSTTLDREFLKISSLNFRLQNRRSGESCIPPEELRCPISSQLMFDPVIIASGQTFERVCIEKWFSDGHNTCPKTQQELPHLLLTPNYSVKGLIDSWCEQNGVPVPHGTPKSLDLNYWRLALSVSESKNTSSMGSVGLGDLKIANVVPMANCIIEETKEVDTINVFPHEEQVEPITLSERYQDFLHVLKGEKDLGKKSKVVEQVRFLLKDDEEGRTFLGAHGFVEVLVQFLELALLEKNVGAQEIGVMCLFNLAVNNNRNKEMMLAAGIIKLLEEMIQNSNSHAPATALYLNLTYLEDAKPIIGSSQVVPFLINCLQIDCELQIKLDALHALYNLATCPSNIPNLLESGMTSALQSLLAAHSDKKWSEKSIAVLKILASSRSGKDQMISSPGLISSLASVLDSDEPIQQEQVLSCLLLLCNDNEKCCQLLLQEGIIPALVSISVNGTSRGKEKSKRLLMMFRKQRQQDQQIQTPVGMHHRAVSVDVKPQSIAHVRAKTKCDFRVTTSDTSVIAMPTPKPKPLRKSISRKKMGKAFRFLWKRTSCSANQF